MMHEEHYFYRQVIDKIPVPIYVLQEGEFQFVNQAFLDFSGYGRQELQGVDFQDLIHPEDVNDIVKMTRLALSGKDHGLPKQLRMKVLLKNGQTKSIQVRPAVIERNAQPAILGVCWINNEQS
jgi:PAS domain S-box-containing protein